MAEKIKKYFAKKKADAKFKLAGPGHKLTETAEKPQSVGTSSKKVTNVSKPSQDVVEAKRQAAEAALARLNSQKKDTNFNTSLAAIQAQVRRELEAQKLTDKPSDTAPSKPICVDLEASQLLAVSGVNFKCPIISDEVLSKNEWKLRIKEFLLEQLEDEKGLTACLMIHSCNYNRTKVIECVDTMCRYLDNIIANPTETKFHKIRCSNPTFCEKVLPIFGTAELLSAAGFEQQTLEHNGNLETFYVFNQSNIDSPEVLEFLRDALKTADKIEIELDRNLRVLLPAQAEKFVDLPSDFFAISPEDLKKEQQLKSEITEKQLQLRTKAMRERDELREIRRYKFALIRVRFPDNLYLQGTFSVYEKLKEVLEFIKENLEDQTCNFAIYSPTGHKFEQSDEESTLLDLRLVPATVLTFQSNCENEIHTYLKKEVMMLIQSI